jgi:hypothetical protein
MGVYITEHNVWVCEAMITKDRRFKIFPDFVMTHGDNAKTWQGRLAQTKNMVGTLMRRYDDIKRTVIVLEKNTRMELMNQYLGAVVVGVMDNAGWDTPLHHISLETLLKFAEAKGRGVSAKTFIDYAKKDFNYGHENPDAVMSFWASMFCAFMDYPPTDPVREKIINSYKKTYKLDRE